MRLVAAWLLLVVFLQVTGVRAESSAAPPLQFEYSSAATLSGVSGDFVQVSARVTNVGGQALSDVTVYLSMFNTVDKTPVDLEDWSAQKAINFQGLPAGQSQAIDLSIHLVNPGEYSLVLVGYVPSADTPTISRATFLHVEARKNLNPGNILVVALGTPLALAIVLRIAPARRRVAQ